MHIWHTVYRLIVAIQTANYSRDMRHAIFDKKEKNKIGTSDFLSSLRQPYQNRI